MDPNRTEPELDLNKRRRTEPIPNQYNSVRFGLWYTSQGFLYTMLNRALRTTDVDIITQMGLFYC
jgi:hypothetical protein